MVMLYDLLKKWNCSQRPASRHGDKCHYLLWSESREITWKPLVGANDIASHEGFDMVVCSWRWWAPRGMREPSTWFRQRMCSLSSVNGDALRVLICRKTETAYEFISSAENANTTSIVISAKCRLIVNAYQHYRYRYIVILIEDLLSNIQWYLSYQLAL